MNNARTHTTPTHYNNQHSCGRRFTSTPVVSPVWNVAGSVPGLSVTDSLNWIFPGILMSTKWSCQKEIKRCISTTTEGQNVTFLCTWAQNCNMQRSLGCNAQLLHSNERCILVCQDQRPEVPLPTQKRATTVQWLIKDLSPEIFDHPAVRHTPPKTYSAHRVWWGCVWPLKNSNNNVLLLMPHSEWTTSWSTTSYW